MGEDQYNEALAEAQARVADRDYAMRMCLVAKGIPYDKALAMSASEALAITVILGEAEGYRFDWATMEWSDPPSPQVDLKIDGAKLARKVRTLDARGPTDGVGRVAFEE